MEPKSPQEKGGRLNNPNTWVWSEEEAHPAIVSRREFEAVPGPGCDEPPKQTGSTQPGIASQDGVPVPDPPEVPRLRAAHVGQDPGVIAVRVDEPANVSPAVVVSQVGQAM